MLGHEQFEELSALAAVGQVSAEELIALKGHLGQCEACRKMSAEFLQIAHSELPIAHRERRWLFAELLQYLKAGQYKRRFLQKAERGGPQLSDAEAAEKPFWSRASLQLVRVEYALIIALLGVAVLVAFAEARSKARYEKSLAADSSEYQQKVRELSGSREALKAQIEQQAQMIAQIRNDLSFTRGQLDAALAGASTSEQRQKMTDAEAQQLKASLAAAFSKSAELQAKLEAEGRHVASLNDEVQRLNISHDADEVQIALHKKGVDELSHKLQAQTEVLHREQQLLSAGRDVRELMGARNLHIVDVFDTNLKGRNRRAFGRVFYTEEKSLIFYAFDLGNEKAVNAKYSFQAWGVLDGAGTAAKSLGIFFADDKAQRRWVLKIDDPNVLQQIDSVFVTVEPFGGAKQPTGEKLLYAFLKSPVNHP